MTTYDILAQHAIKEKWIEQQTTDKYQDEVLLARYRDCDSDYFDNEWFLVNPTWDFERYEFKFVPRPRLHKVTVYWYRNESGVVYATTEKQNSILLHRRDIAWTENPL
jgi:hypothetical protein